jgi:1D-myo-inositol 3-kinase
MPRAPTQLLVLGHITRDEIGDQIGKDVRLGGAASYAALAAARLGFATTLVTVAPPDDPLLDPLRRTPGLTLHCAASPVMTTFALRYEDGGRRTLALRQVARPLLPDDLPARWRRGAVAAGADGVVYVGPVAGECDRALCAALADGLFVAAGLQGWLRHAGAGGVIEPALAPEALDPPRVAAAVLSQDDHADAELIADRYLAAGAIVAITRAARGATLRTHGQTWDIAASPATEVDPTGAGDVFGVVLALGLAAGRSPADAGAAAAWAAARIVEGPGLGTLPTAPGHADSR